jgi:hypothetical protein
MSTVYYWEDTSTATYTAQSITIGDLLVTVCLDDEGPLRPAFYWDIERDGVRVYDGWESSVARARDAAIDEAEAINDERNQ